MRKFFPVILFLFFASFLTSAQTPTPQPAKEDDVVKISTTLIQVDVTVTDKKGNVVTDLKPEDFEIFENNQKQDITNFSFVASETATPKSSPPPKDANTKNIPVPTAQLRPEQVQRTIALVVDDLSLSATSVYFVRQSLKKFVDTQMQNGDLVAIIRTGGGTGALEQFTSDKRQLYAAIENIRWNSVGNGRIGSFEPISSSLERTNSTGGGEELQAEAEERSGNQKELNKEFNDIRNRIFATATLGALGYIIKGMSELPGRKSILMLSNGFKLYTEFKGVKDFNIIREAIESLTDLANRSAVVIYTLDARGLETLGFTAEDDTSSLSQQQSMKMSSNRSLELFETQDGLVYLAQQTGGTSIINNNDLSGGIRKILNEQKGYYLVGYSPDSETFDPQKRRFNKLNIKVKRPDLKVRYRSGFFGLTDDETERTQIARTKTQTPQQQINAALTSPFAAGEIELHLNTLFGNDAKAGGFMRSFLHVSAKDLKFSDEADGKHKATFVVVAMSFGEKGLIADQIAKSYTLTLKKEGYEEFLRSGFVYNFVFPVKKPGAYQMRVALRDSGSGKVGSANQFIEVPNLKKGNLTISGILLKNLTVKEFENWQNGMVSPEDSAQSNTMDTDTSLRKFKRGTILRYGYEVYNAAPDSLQKQSLTVQTKIYRDGKLSLDGKAAPIVPGAQPVAAKIVSGGALSLGSEMPPGDYILQIIVSDSSQKNKIAAQWVQFEIIE